MLIDNIVNIFDDILDNKNALLKIFFYLCSVAILVTQSVTLLAACFTNATC